MDYFLYCPLHLQLSPLSMYVSALGQCLQVQGIDEDFSVARTMQSHITCLATWIEDMKKLCRYRHRSVEKSKTAYLHHTYLWFLKQGKTKLCYLRIFSMHWTCSYLDRFLFPSLKLLGFMYFKCHYKLDLQSQELNLSFLSHWDLFGLN